MINCVSNNCVFHVYKFTVIYRWLLWWLLLLYNKSQQQGAKNVCSYCSHWEKRQSIKDYIIVKSNVYIINAWFIFSNEIETKTIWSQLM